MLVLCINYVCLGFGVLLFSDWLVLIVYLLFVVWFVFAVFCLWCCWMFCCRFDCLLFVV